MKESWLTLHPDTFIWIKGSRGIIYNSVNYRHFTFENRGVIARLCSELMQIDNLYCTSIGETLTDVAELNYFIQNIVATEAGYITEKGSYIPKPVSYMPVLKINNNIEALRSRNRGNSQTGKIFNNLTTLTVHVNGDKTIDPLYHKQFIAPSNSNEVVDMADLGSLLKQGGDYLSHLNIVGDFSTYPYKDSLLRVVNEGRAICNLYGTLSSWQNTDRSLLSHILGRDKIHIHVIVDNVELLEVEDDFSVLLNEYPNNISFIFPVVSVGEYETALMQIERHRIESYEIIPVLNGKNLAFFEEYVFTTQDDMNSVQFCKREIFSHFEINANFFGELVVMPNKDVYSNINHPPIGTTNTSLYDLVFTELDQGRSWRMVRDKQPCSSCLYQWLCPSPSNYEIILGRLNLCNVTS